MNSSGDFIEFKFESDQMKEVTRQGSSELSLKSPMPGIITKVYKKTGDSVKKGDSILAMEAMKMQLVIKAEFDCTIETLLVAENDFVEAGKQIVQLAAQKK